MKLLIIGGTRFLGRHVAATAQARALEVTLFNRGNHPPPFTVETIHGDRYNDLANLKDRRWDVVVDTCGHLARAVKAAGLNREKEQELLNKLATDHTDCVHRFKQIRVYNPCLSVAKFEW